MISKATAGENTTRSEAVNDLRKQLENVQETAPCHIEPNNSIAAPFDLPSNEWFDSPTQQSTPPRQLVTQLGGSGGLLTTGGETFRAANNR